MNSTSRGLLICFEGLDRSGKSTQAKLLKDFLEKNRSETSILRFPERSTSIGKIIDEHLTGKIRLSNEAIHVLFSSNRWEYKDHILSELKKGNNIILDRYAYSGIAYSASKGLELEWCKLADRGLPKPDIVFYITLDESVIEKRDGFGSEIFEKVEFQKKVKNNYELLKEDNWTAINGKNDISVISKEISDYLTSAAEELGKKEVSKLWWP